MNEKIILFTKIPEKGYGKSRLLKYLSDDIVLEISNNLLNYTYNKIKNYNHVVYFSGKKELLDYIDCEKEEQVGNDIGQKMKNALLSELKNSDKVILIGSDFASLPNNIFKTAFSQLDKFDVVTASSTDGGYGLIGMKDFHDIFTTIDYSSHDVYNQLVEKCNTLGLTHKNLCVVNDIDELEDLVLFETASKECKLLGAGEYNINYIVNDLVYRINTKSQLNLENKQIEYEFKSLKFLEDSEVTPKVYSYKSRGNILPCGSLYMDYLEGRPLDYTKDLKVAAYLLSKIHNHSINAPHFIRADQPFKNMYNEFLSMYSKYKKWASKDIYVCKYIEKFLNKAVESGLSSPIKNPCIINTELNNMNFIMGEQSYIIDWEKPIIGEAEQDLAHFVAPTTTNWKTDIILCEEDISKFLLEYKKYRNFDAKKFNKYIMFNIIRGITWCSMAKVEYEGNRGIKNNETLLKINKFLSLEFLELLERRFFI